jgi:hypothetical protein
MGGYTEQLTPTPGGFLIHKNVLKTLSKSKLQLWWLYEKLCMNDPSVVTDFKHRDRILQMAMGLFTHPAIVLRSAWASNQIGGNRTLRMEFCRDTLNYIATGKRVYDIAIWEDLLSTFEDTSSWHFDETIFEEEFHDNYEEFRKMSTVAIISKWVSYEHGYADLLTTLRILFLGEKQ